MEATPAEPLEETEEVDDEEEGLVLGTKSSGTFFSDSDFMEVDAEGESAVVVLVFTPGAVSVDDEGEDILPDGVI